MRVVADHKAVWVGFLLILFLLVRDVESAQFLESRRTGVKLRCGRQIASVTTA